MPSKKSASSTASAAKARRVTGSAKAAKSSRSAPSSKRKPSIEASDESPKPVAHPSPSVVSPSQPVVSPSPTPVDVQSAELRFLASLFKLNDLEQRLISTLAQRSEALTVEALATQLGVASWQVGALLMPHGLLRASSLVEAEPFTELGPVRPDDRIHLGRGVWLALHDRELLPTLIPGLSVLPSSDPDEAWAAAFVADRPAQAVLELVKERLVSIRPLLLLLSGCSAETTALLTQAIRLRLSRPVFYVDGSALVGWPQPELSVALRRLRRDADIKGAALVVQDAELLGAAWRSLTHPKPTGQTAPVILCSSGVMATPRHFFAGSHGSPLQLLTHALRPTLQATATTSTATAAAAPAEAETPDVDRSREEARRQAAVDAARAMGKPIPKELLSAEPAASPAVKAPAPSSTASVAAPAKTAPVSASATVTAPAPARVEPARAAEPATSAPARPVNPRLAAALAKAGLPPAGSAAYQSERSAAAEKVSAPAAVAAPAAEVATPVVTVASSTPAATVEVVTTPAQATEAVSSVSASAAPASSADAATEEPADGLPLPLSEDAKLDELLNVAKNTASNQQRAQVLRKLAGAKSPLIIQLFRMFLNHPNQAVRSAAEAGMESIFGINWNRARAIAPPIQPPRSDDGGRGPGGAF